jgi:membrane protein implicated in regulation of membrane protease activity
MDPHSETPSPSDLASEAGGLIAGLGIITFQFFPLALPLLILVIGPLAVLALAAAVLAIPILLPLWLGRLVLRAMRRRSEARRTGHPRVGPSTVKLPTRDEGDRAGQIWPTPGRPAARGHRDAAGQRG